MHWVINFEVNCNSTNIDHIRNQLYSHHCILSAEKPIEEILYEGAEVTTISDIQDKLECKAMVFHHEDEQHFKNFVDKLTGSEVTFHPEPVQKRLKGVFKVTKFTPIIVFVVLLAHESIVNIFHLELDPWILALSLSAVGAGLAFAVDFIVLWRDHFFNP